MNYRKDLQNHEENLIPNVPEHPITFEDCVCRCR